jgi:TldD protein
VKEEKFFASSEGIITDQTVHRCWPQVSVTAVAADGGDFQSRNSTSMQPMGLGYEYVLDQDLPGQAPAWAEDAVAMLEARSVDPGRYGT